MARSIRWQIPFKDIDETAYTINIYDEEWSGGVTTLKGGTEPIVTDEDRSTDPFEPVRTTTGYITFIDETGAMADVVKASGTLSRYVTLMRGGSLVWCGFLQPEEYSGAWTAPPYEVSLPLMSQLEALKNIKFEATGNVCTLGSIIVQCLDAAKTDVTLVAHSKYPSETCLNATVLDLCFSIEASKDAKKRYYGVNTDLEDPADFYSCYKVIEEICKFFGWSAHEQGTTIHFTSTDMTLDYEEHTMANLRAGNYTSARTTNGTPVALPQVSSDAHKRSVSFPMSQIRLTIENKKVSPDILSTQDIGLMDYIEGTNTDETSDTRATWYGDIFSNDSFIRTYQYSVNSNGTAGSAKTDLRMVKSNIYSDTSETMVTAGGYAGNDCYVYNYDLSTAEKRFTFVLSCTPGNIDEAVGNYGNPAIDIMSRDLYNFTGSSGYILLEYDFTTISFEKGEKKLEGPEDDETKWNTRWPIARLEYRRTDGTSLWYLNVDSAGNVVSNGWWLSTVQNFYMKQNDLTSANFRQFGKMKGQSIPLPTGTGHFVLHLCTQSAACIGEEAVYNGMKYLRIQNLNLSLASYRYYQQLHANYELDEIHYNRDLGNDSREVYKRTSVLFYSEFAGSISYSYGKVFNSVDPYPSQLNRMEAWYGHSQVSLDVDVRSTSVSHADLITISGSQYVIGAMNISWRDKNTKLKLLKK